MLSFAVLAEYSTYLCFLVNMQLASSDRVFVYVSPVGSPPTMGRCEERS